MSYQSFENLAVWQKARELRKEISALVKSFPREELFRLTDQLVRASRGVTAAIAEGHGRYHYQENIQYCRIARGSAIEIIDHLTVAIDENFISDEVFIAMKERILEIERMLNGYIAYLKKRKDEG
jgi:four helix bundle protein